MKVKIKIKEIILIGVAAFCICSCNENIPAPPVDNGAESESSYNGLLESDVLKGHIRVKLKEEPAGEIAVRSTNGSVTTGISALDKSVSGLKITRMERTFPPAGKYEERTRREGLHLWYDIWFSEETPSTRAVEEVSVLGDIEIAVPVVKIISYGASANRYYDTFASAGARASFLFNDPDLPKLWSYSNPGTESWQEKNADIRLFDIWSKYNGHPDIIVSVVDGGIYLEHPDLKDNIWINQEEIAGNDTDDDDNGYIDDVHGFNFVSNTGEITPHRHGTHVAGTIAAANNNGIGISGIAGGNGTANSGVKLMSCQVFAYAPSSTSLEIIATNMGAAIKYGADNGAVISQNSWGYAVGSTAVSSSYIDPSHKAAIDYFVKYAGCDNDGTQLPGSPMKGGIVLFAAGNSNSSNPKISAPADYEKVIGVSAMASNYKKTLDSNYGDFIDISAPGGESNSVDGILSTTIPEYNYYEYRYGTSMACPHVSAVAALVIEKNGVGKRGFTAKQLEEILFSTAYDIDTYNPSYAGLLGAGCVDATAALLLDTLLVPPFQIIANPVTDGTFSFKVNSSDLSGEAVLSFVNGTGGLAMRKTITANRFKLVSVDISALAAGYYVMIYEIDGNKIRERIIKY